MKAISAVSAALALLFAAGCERPRPGAPVAGAARSDEARAAPASTPDTGAAALRTTWQICGEAPDEPSCSDSVERRALAASQGFATRDGSALRFRPSGSSVVTLVNDTTPGESFVAYRFLGRLAGSGYGVVQRDVYEGGDFLLVSGRGDTASVPAIPVASPDGQRAVVTSADFEEGSEPNVVEVWRLADDGPRLEYRLHTASPADSAGGWGAERARWLDDRTIEVTRTTPTPAHQPIPPAWLTRSESGWALRESPPGH